MNIDYFHPILLKAGKAVHNGDWNWRNVRSPFFRIYYVAEGSASVEIGDTTYQLQQNNMYVIPPFVLHTTSCKELFVHYYIHLYNPNQEHADLFSEYQIPVCVKSSRDKMVLFQRIVEMNPDLSIENSDPQSYDNSHGLQQSILHHNQQAFQTQLETLSIIYLIISDILKQSTRRNVQHDARIRSVMEYVNAHPSEKFSTAGLASRACLSTEYFIRLFKQSVGYTPIQYVNAKRMEKAQLLLAFSDKSLSRIAEEVGFSGLSYFVKTFRRLTGLTPSRYREEILKQK